MSYSKKTYENQSRIREQKSKRDRIVDSQLDSLAESSVIAHGDGDTKNLRVNDEPLNIQINNGKVLYAPSNNTDGIPQEDNELVNKVYVDDAVASAGGGASALNDLSDVTYSSGDLTISSLDKIVTSGSLTLDSASDIELNADSGTVNIKDGSNNMATVTKPDVNSGELQIKPNNFGDISKITTTIHGATTISTSDVDGTSGHLTLDADGDITLDAASGNIYVKDNGGNYTPGSDYEIATKKYVDDNAGGSTTLKGYMDWYYISANLAIKNAFYAATHHDEFGVSNAINTGISSYTDTEHSDIWRVARYAKRIPYNATITKVMTHVESTGASADSDIEVGVWIASFSSLSLNQQFPSTENIAIDNLAKIDFDFDTATRLMFSETTSFNATSLTQGDWMFITLRRTTGTDGSSFNCHTTVTMDIS